MLDKEKVLSLDRFNTLVYWMNIIQTEQTEIESPQKLRLQGYAGKLCCISL